MNWGSASEFVAMGGYGYFVWGAYGVFAALMLADAWLALRRQRQALLAAAIAAQENVDP